MQAGAQISQVLEFREVTQTLKLAKMNLEEGREERVLGFSLMDFPLQSATVNVVAGINLQ